jgi:hypothetical protein
MPVSSFLRTYFTDYTCFGFQWESPGISTYEFFFFFERSGRNWEKSSISESAHLVLWQL